MSKTFREDLTGQRFGRLTVLEFVPNDKRYSYWKCRCDCGNVSIVDWKRLKDKYKGVKSCGCLQKEAAKRVGHLNYKHGKGKLYSIWSNMKARCNNPHNIRYKVYGDRGITVCDEWKNDFMVFREWALNNGYSDDLTIDRIDNDKGYSPENCRWISNAEQQRNKRNNTIVEYHRRNITLLEAAERTDIKFNTLKSRYYRGDRGERLFRPAQKKNK